jgi:hypothetical protein
LHPRISTWIAIAGAGLALGGTVSEGVGVAFACVTAGVAEAASEAVIVGTRMMGVGVTIPGVRVGIGVQMGKGCGLTLKMSHAPRSMARTQTEIKRFIIRCLRTIVPGDGNMLATKNPTCLKVIRPDSYFQRRIANTSEGDCNSFHFVGE